MSEKKEEFAPARVNWMDAKELAEHILDMEESDSDDVEQAIYDKFECSMETFEDIVGHLLPLVDKMQSPISGVMYRGFSKPIGDNMRCWIVKDEVTQNKD
jgi:hypothetical protein